MTTQQLVQENISKYQHLQEAYQREIEKDDTITGLEKTRIKAKISMLEYFFIPDLKKILQSIK